jgi:hypothetical protein
MNKNATQKTRFAYFCLLMLISAYFFVAKANNSDAAEEFRLTCQACFWNIKSNAAKASDPDSIERCEDLLNELEKLISNLPGCPLEETYIPILVESVQGWNHDLQ